MKLHQTHDTLTDESPNPLKPENGFALGLRQKPSPHCGHFSALAIAFLAAATISLADSVPPPDDLETDYRGFENMTPQVREDVCKAAAQKHLALWQKATGEMRAKEAQAVNFYAWEGQQLDLIRQVLADGRMAETEVKPPDEEKVVSVQVKLDLPVDQPQGWHVVQPIWRRITSGLLEVWTPRQGWLFNAKGDLLRHVEVKRDPTNPANGIEVTGREWFGAFLPDGHWITTELHEGDGRVYIFDKQDRCTHEIKGSTLVKGMKPTLEHADRSPRIVPWARSTKTGDAWLVRIGSEEGIGEVLLTPDGTWQALGHGKGRSIWETCQYRQLGTRLCGGHVCFNVESDDGVLRFHKEEAAHGPQCGYPDFFLVNRRQEDQGHEQADEEGIVTTLKIPLSLDSFGFWPGSHDLWVRDMERTWFFQADKKYHGWMAGDRVGDATDHQGMIFRIKDGRCITVSPKLKATLVQRFLLPDGTQLLPMELHPDIGLGVFALVRQESDEPQDPASGSPKLPDNYDILHHRHLHLYVARWEVPEGKR